ncbi:MAG TPA: UbiA family prenyltransferase [Allosphingosinicella sp.]|jgi:4-hydroxybenzoate polyprenyltransferase|nr:UbiA family prenyltransferase [Allosphingosinicella sp.]
MSAGLSRTVRAGEWWHYKLVPILTAFFATVVMLEHPIASAWGTGLTLLLAIVPGAAYVSLLNDLTDLDEDRRAGKANRMEGRPTAFRIAALLIPLAIGVFFLVLWRRDPPLFAAYLGAWVAFSLYSLPPLRLKVRGLSGVLADACGAHLFPTLVAILLGFRAGGREADSLWLSAGAAWAFGYGLRGILWHQLADRDNDRTAGVRTFAQRHPPRVASWIGTWIAFPIELAGLALLLWMCGLVLPVALLAVYVALAALRVQLWSMIPVVVQSRDRYFIVLHEYYDVLLPLAILVGSSLRHPADLIALALYLALFHHRPLESLRDLRKLIGRMASDLRHRR